MFPGGLGISAAGSKAHAVSHPVAYTPSRQLDVCAHHKHVEQVSELLILRFEQTY